jgi:starch synthase
MTHSTPSAGDTGADPRPQPHDTSAAPRTPRPPRVRRTPARRSRPTTQDPATESPPPPPLIHPDGRPVSVVHLAAELAPFARSGGLGEAVASLAGFQARSGIPTAVVMPLYTAVRDRYAAELQPVGPVFRVPVGRRSEAVRLWRHVPAPDAGDTGPRPAIWFIQSDEYFARPGLYGPPGGDYLDNARRYACFCAAALTALPIITGGAPVLLHAHDWHTALAPVYLRTAFARSPLHTDICTVLSVHNAGYQGHFAPTILPDLGLPSALFNWRQMEWHGRVNLLKGGLVFADAVVTVSPTHAHELRTAAGGFGLDGVFVSLRDRFIGITNGIDQQRWNPATDPLIYRTYSAEDLRGKRRCRLHLQRAMGLRRMDTVPIFALSARLVSQKGLDLILGDPGYFALDAQFVFLGSGEPRYEAALAAIAERAPTRIAVHTTFSDELEHRLIAGADMCLMPSQYEPCGLTQMRAQRYGTIPVARRVGGLADTIEDGVTGFLFDDYTAEDFMRAATRAVDHFQDTPAWHDMMREAMSRDFGWEQSARRYLALYRRVVGRAPAP